MHLGIGLFGALGKVRSAFCLGYVAHDMSPVLKINGNLDYVQAHVHHMLATGAVISGPGIAFQSIGEVTTTKVVVSQVIVTPTNALLDGIGLVVLKVRVQLLQL